MGRYGMIGILWVFLFAHMAKCAQGTCRIDGVTDTQWGHALVIDITDTDEGISFEAETYGITEIASFKYLPLYTLYNIPYVNATLEDEVFRLELLESFKRYEAIEISDRMAYEIVFNCENGTRPLMIVYKITDTNNNAQVFSQSAPYNFSVAVPILKGFQIDYQKEIMVKDNDLTTYGLDVTLQANEYFDVTYESMYKPTKYHKLFLTAKKDIAEFEPMTLYIDVTDKDRTGDRRLTTRSSIGFTSGNGFPNEDVEFEDHFYVGSFDSDAPEAVFEKVISLRKGYGSDVSFTLEGDGSEYFSVNHHMNNITLLRNSEIPEEIIMNPDALTLTLFATKKSSTAKAFTILNIHLVKEPNCWIFSYPESLVNGYTVYFNDTEVGTIVKLVHNNVQAVLRYYGVPGELNNGTYVSASLDDGYVYISTTNRFPLYEEYETSNKFTLYVDLQCKRGQRTLKLNMRVLDNNNHAPDIITPFNVNYEVDLPLPTGYSISRTYGELIIRDVDLTNYAISVSYNEFRTDLKFRGFGQTKKDYVFELVTTRPIDTLNTTIRVTAVFFDMDLTNQPRRNLTRVISVSPKT